MHAKNQRHFPADIRFCHPWRKYQQRILDELSTHLDDNRLHVIAPPGSGKTVLGLEVIRRLDKPTLILSPTTTIRNQWIDRFVTLFLPPQTGVPDWITSDIRDSALFCAATYQALHAVNIRDNTFSNLKNSDIGTIVLDEAHHLRNEWWKALDVLKRVLTRVTILSLTATPPYDAPQVEWERYQSLCGPVDAEISVPELVFEKNLAPHQDYVCFSHPEPKEYHDIRRFRDGVSTFLDHLFLDLEFFEAILDHPWILDPESNLDAIYENVEYFSAMVIFLRQTGKWIPSDALKILGVKNENIPAPDLRWMEILLSNVLFRDRESFKNKESVISELERKLGRIGATGKKKVFLRGTDRIKKTITGSVGKLEMIVEIVKRESETLKEKLRLVILTDFIYKKDIPKITDEHRPLHRIGVGPIFEKIRREYIWGIRPGVLCGTLVIIPGSAISDLRIIAAEEDLDQKTMAFSPLSCDPDFFEVHFSGKGKHAIVRMITRLFRLGEINVLIGTKSLLGEGWDAPCINTLIIASNVGSWVLSNQIRGRAIRTFSDDQEKTSNIWHLVSVEPVPMLPGDDFRAVADRFKGFVGLSFQDRLIQDGIERLGITHPPVREDEVRLLNDTMFLKAEDRAGIREKWRSALEQGSQDFRVRYELRTRKASLPERAGLGITFVPVWKQLIVMFGLGGMFFFWGSEILTGPFGFRQGMAFLFCFLFLFWIPKTLKSVFRTFRYGKSGTVLFSLGEVLLQCLVETNLFQTPIRDMKIAMEKGTPGRLNVRLEGGSYMERNMFPDTLRELVDPIDNPRYLILADIRIFGGSGKYYFPVPKILGANKGFAECFLDQWKKRISPAKLIYTRSIPGRRHLVKARLATLNKKKSDRHVLWK